jgi:hypothetical protein
LKKCKKNSKIEKIEKIGPLIKHGPHLIKFTIISCISETIDTLKAYFKIGT